MPRFVQRRNESRAPSTRSLSGTGSMPHDGVSSTSLPSPVLTDQVLDRLTTHPGTGVRSGVKRASLRRVGPRSQVRRVCATKRTLSPWIGGSPVRRRSYRVRHAQAAAAPAVPTETNSTIRRARDPVGRWQRRVAHPVAERVLTLRELNRATLARQLLLHRTRLSPTAVIERLVGMQAQSPQAPYVGIWTRTTGFRRGSLERLLRQSAIIRATATRQTLHLVTPRDYALVRAAFPWETKRAKQLAPSVRALAARGPVTSAEALAHLESEYGLVGVDARRAWQTARLASHIV